MAAILDFENGGYCFLASSNISAYICPRFVILVSKHVFGVKESNEAYSNALYTEQNTLYMRTIRILLVEHAQTIINENYYCCFYPA